MESLSSVEMLEKAFRSGQITTIEYFMELGIYYSAYNNLLKIEMEYYKVIAQLNKYKL